MGPDEEAGDRHRMVSEAAKRVRSSPLSAWSLACVAFGLALGLRFGFDHILPAGFPYLTFFPAVILTAFFAGPRPGLVCAIACGLSAWFWFIPPFGSFTLGTPVLIALAFYVFVVGVDIALIEAMHGAVRRLEAERAINQQLLAQQKLHLEESQAQQRQQRVLQRELSHRMKNTLAMVQAVVSQSLRNATDPKEAATMASARIQALARAQDMLTATDWAASDVKAIVEASIAPHVDDPARLRLAGPRVDLDARHALGLALAIHELATNATKYGALSADGGHIAVSWDVGEGERFSFEWREEGGPSVSEPNRRGFGSRLTERVVPGYFQGHAQTEFAPRGLVYQLDGSLAADRHDHS
ncbi:sensor histidine kinase [Aureimonas phyllosphaerae]|uniref:histidine kinase n=1 Tax=Aureimonas phyllosphaerae TaxID=1166078 RepID=A0A7W6FU34_9HYPH|nr:HWE histidine kinase domain-containing protein [Aureimonas phyllosphaerae]MBB3934592.1 two-component sensor histidine kinase [Aureimonas phyllosphaerae]MBB3958192.1 two-component sensor histidine kinase [Aureimonas phyllosphaerae]